MRLEKAGGFPGYDVAHAIGLNPRIGKQFLNIGLDYGGSCFPKDLKALESFAKNVTNRK